MRIIQLNSIRDRTISACIKAIPVEISKYVKMKLVLVLIFLINSAEQNNQFKVQNWFRKTSFKTQKRTLDLNSFHSQNALGLSAIRQLQTKNTIKATFSECEKIISDPTDNTCLSQIFNDDYFWL